MFKNPKVVIAFFIIAAVLGGIFYLIYPTPEEYNPEPDGVACTLEAKMCPDGSYVGRVGPDCQFALCPIPEGAFMEDGTIE